MFRTDPGQTRARPEPERSSQPNILSLRPVTLHARKRPVVALVPPAQLPPPQSSALYRQLLALMLSG